MPRLGMGELLVILLIVVVLFGASKLPQLGAGLGQGIKSFKKALGGDDEKDGSSRDGSTGSGDKPGATKQ
jgi:sec-independent protein translocase protein TatA